MPTDSSATFGGFKIFWGEPQIQYWGTGSLPSWSGWTANDFTGSLDTITKP